MILLVIASSAVALLVFATYFPCRFFWTGGSFLRWDWLFYTAAAVACLRRGRPVLGGLALGYAALLRVFPAVLALGPALALAVVIRRSLGRQSAASQGDGSATATDWVPALEVTLRREPARPHLQFLFESVRAQKTLGVLGQDLGWNGSRIRKARSC